MKAESEWPVDRVSREKITEDLNREDPEVKKSASINVVQSERSRIDELFERYSSWDDLKRGVAWLLRVKDFLRDRVRCKEASMKREPIAVEEYRRAEQEIAKYVQRQNFASIIVELQQESSKLKGRSSKGRLASIRKLKPMLVEGLLRVGGRLVKAPISYDARHPILLPKDHHITKLIIDHYHRLVGHSGPSITWARLRQKFWVLKGSAAVRRVIGNCLPCKRRNAKPMSQLMADLPLERVNPEKPAFSSVGVDYFGPMYVKQGRSQVKRYGCLFTCIRGQST
ncbi:hypothetical protein HOLleu_20859 [Holothuria leucospilota]|uniref:Integrase zinc-binding domain-containing protein n=1 Tax=Holothuria leucospilota TaxID=206669 RepID=A0A9Q1H6E8_HOLLE|nr:hypothetical protein HOLleu_20859 [Holothuria leucospilota]